MKAIYKSKITGYETEIKIAETFQFERNTRTAKGWINEVVKVAISTNGAHYELSELTII